MVRDFFGNRLASGGQDFYAAVMVDNTTMSLVGRPANVDPNFDDRTLNDELNRTVPLVELDISDEGDGSYLAHYRLTIAAEYDVLISLNQTNIGDMPSSLVIWPDRPAASTAMLSEAALQRLFLANNRVRL